MSRSSLKAGGHRRYRPDTLGHSLPLAAGMRKSFLALSAGFLMLLAVVTWLWGDVLGLWQTAAAAPESTPAALLSKVADRTYEDGRGLPLWDPGPALTPVAPPDLLLVRDAGMTIFRLPGDRNNVSSAVGEAQAFLEDGDPVAAASILGRELRRDEDSWSLHYNLGMVALRSGSPVDAQERFERARRIAIQREDAFPGDADYFAARAATRYSLGLARLKDPTKCEEGIVELKRAIGDMKAYVNILLDDRFDRTILARDENDLFPVGTFDLDSYQVRNALVEGYLLCERYPEEYFRNRTWAKDFQTSEYSKPLDPEILEGPFADELGACVREAEPDGRCWALSNLNKVYLSSKPYLPFDEGSELRDRLRDSAPSLARMVYNIAVLRSEQESTDSGAETATEPLPKDETPGESGRAPASLEGTPYDGPTLTSVDFLEIASRINRAKPDAELQARIEQFGRHLAVETKDYGLLGMAYTQTPIEELVWDADSRPEEIKGMAWTLKERCEQLLRSGRPEALAPTLDGVRQRLVEKEDLESFAAWRKRIRKRLQREVSDRLAASLEKGAIADALALRRLDEPYLQPGWTRRAWTAWLLRPAALVLPLSLFALWLGFRLARFVHLKVVRPYLVFNSRFYESEFAHRHKALAKRNIPFTGDELSKQEDVRDA